MKKIMKIGATVVAGVLIGLVVVICINILAENAYNLIEIIYKEIAP